MTKNLKFFAVVFLISLPFWWGMNILQGNLEDFFWLSKISKNPAPFFIAQINQKVAAMTVENFFDCRISAESAISIETDGISDNVIFKKQGGQKRPIASLTKLMTAIVASEFYQSSERIAISKEAVKQDENTGNLKVGEVLKIEDLLKIMLIESSNDAAYAVSEPAGIDGFTYLMNKKTQEIGLNDTYFVNPTGLENDKPEHQEMNYSTAEDLVKVGKYLIKRQPFILEILSKKEEPLYFDNGSLHHILKNTNELLGEIDGIIGGKTGFTDKAGGCLLLVLKSKKPGGYFVNVVLNSPDRFGDMRRIINCYNQ